jgi:hypothetical protein
VEQGDSVAKNRSDHPKQEEQSGGEGHFGRFWMGAEAAQGFSRIVRQAARFRSLLIRSTGGVVNPVGFLAFS